MKLLLIGALLLAAGTATAASNDPTILEVLLYNGQGIPKGYIDSTTRPDATSLCNKLIETQSKLYGNAISRSRCIIKVQE